MNIKLIIRALVVYLRDSADRGDLTRTILQVTPHRHLSILISRPTEWLTPFTVRLSCLFHSLIRLAAAHS